MIHCVGQVARLAAVVSLPGPEPAAVVAPEVAKEELGGCDCGLDPRPVAGRRTHLGQRGAHQCVPLRQHLVVEPGTDPLLACENKRTRRSSTDLCGRTRSPRACIRFRIVAPSNSLPVTPQ